MAMTTDFESGFEKSSIELVGYDMTHSANELITYEALGLGGAVVVTLYRKADFA